MDDTTTEDPALTATRDDERRGDEVRREKLAPTTAPVEDFIRKRWSPRAFSDDRVTDHELRTLLEAARWAPSSYNEQPWRFLIARRDDPEAFQRMLACLDEGNRAWAEDAAVLMLTVAKLVFDRTGEKNRHAFHDVGLAVGNLLNQATEMDLYVHQMAGIDPERARRTFDVPEGFEVVAGVALGHLGDPRRLDDPDRRASETEERSRRPLDEMVFEGSWGESSTVAERSRQISHAATS